jgi:hypothetical protein
MPPMTPLLESISLKSSIEISSCPCKCELPELSLSDKSAKNHLTFLNGDGVFLVGNDSSPELTIITRYPNELVHTTSTSNTITFDDFLFDRSPSLPSNGKYDVSVLQDAITTPKLDLLQLEDQARRSLEVENAGGKSAMSEMLSIQYFETIHKASDFLLEMEIQYWCTYKLVDYSCLVDGKRVGVSVTRAMHYIHPSLFTLDSARTLINKKLYGLVVARDSVLKTQRFFHSVLHVWCQSQQIAEYMRQAYDELEGSLGVKGVMIMILTVYSNNEIYHLDKGFLQDSNYTPRPFTRGRRIFD